MSKIDPEIRGEMAQARALALLPFGAKTSVYSRWGPTLCLIALLCPSIDPRVEIIKGGWGAAWSEAPRD